VSPSLNQEGIAEGDPAFSHSRLKGRGKGQKDKGKPFAPSPLGPLCPGFLGSGSYSFRY
jgi:hypothetical protein